MLRALRIQSSTKHGSSVQIGVLTPLLMLYLSVAFDIAVSNSWQRTYWRKTLTVVQGIQSSLWLVWLNLWLGTSHGNPADLPRQDQKQSCSIAVKGPFPRTHLHQPSTAIFKIVLKAGKQVFKQEPLGDMSYSSHNSVYTHKWIRE